MKSKMRNRILALLLVVAMVMNGGVSALASGAAPTANEETGHVHTDECYTEEKTVTCGQEEIQGHTHGEGCYTTTVTCGQEEFEGHTHTDDCYTTTVSSCGKEEHSHSEECDTEESPCGKEEHIHDGCNEEVKELICDLEESAGHTHGDGCKTTELTCSQEEVAGHTHTEECYTTTKTLTCTIPTATAAKNPEAKTTCEVCGLEECTCEKEAVVCEVCGLEECTCEKEVVVCEVCGLEECTCEKETTGCICGNEACECENCEEGCTCTSVEEFVESVEFEDEDIKVTVTAVDENAIPANVTLKVLPIVAGDEETEVQYAEVEKQLQEEVEDEETDILGFVAYDITFVDEEGIEVEPKGQVQVFMEYKKAIAPAATDKVEEADVTVMHLEEDENGQVAQVVDMGKENQLSAIETTTANEVTKAEFATGSFSVFTIIWTAESVVLKAYCVNINGKAIGEEEFEISKLDIPNSSTDTEVSVESLQKDLSVYNYNYSKAYVAVAATAEPTVSNIDTLCYADNKWQYKVGSGEWTDFGKDKLFFVYTTSLEAAKLPVVNTIEKGINISLFNYTGETNTAGGIYENGFYFTEGGQGIDTGKGYGRSNIEIQKNSEGDTVLGKQGQYTYGTPQYARQNMLCYNLDENGYPVLNANYYGGATNDYSQKAQTKETSAGSSIDYLFKSGAPGVTAHTGLTGLLQLNSEGYYYYDSANNHAEKNGSRIDVYDAKLTHRSRSTGQFLPFDSISSADYDEDNNIYISNHSNTLYNSDGTVKDVRYGDMWFGMKIDTNFYQPKDGKVNDKNMIFSFSGDDDVWVFFDGVKVLDIGGIHGVTNGNINFSTGVVTVDSTGSTPLTTTILECYRKAYAESPSGKEGSEHAYLSQYFDFTQNQDGTYTYSNTYKNFTQHDMKFFYLERGSGASNCKVTFNLPVLPEDSVTINKEIENYDEAESVLNDVEFGFKMHTKAEGVNDYSVLANKSYKLIKADGTEDVAAHSTDANGIFKLKHNEQAVFEGITQGTKYYVEEVAISGAEYSDVIIESNGVVNESGQSIAANLTNATMQSKELEVGTNYIVNFKNVCANFQHLIIEKQMKAEDVVYADPNTTYTFEVTVGGGLYNGKYKVGTSYENALTTEEKTATNGQISLKAGEVAVVLGNATGTKNGATVTGFPARTSFVVKELNVDQTLYGAPIYEFTAGTVDNLSKVDGYNGSASAQIKLDQNAYVTTTNSLLYGDLLITKTLPRYNDTFDGATFVYDVEAICNGKVIYSDVLSLTFDGPGEKTYTFDSLFPAGTKVTVEEVYSGASYEPVAGTVTKHENIGIVADSVVTAGTAEIATAAFANDYVDGRINSGSAVVNTFHKDTSGWSYTATAKDQAAIPSNSVTGGENTQSDDGKKEKSGTATES